MFKTEDISSVTRGHTRVFGLICTVVVLYCFVMCGCVCVCVCVCVYVCVCGWVGLCGFCNVWVF